LAQLDEQTLNDDIVRRAIALRRQRRIKIPDAVVAATALHLGLPLMTRNVRDFGGIDGLVLVNPFAPDV
jgi:predicted nucleic acid-binding protein